MAPSAKTFKLQVVNTIGVIKYFLWRDFMDFILEKLKQYNIPEIEIERYNQTHRYC